MKIGPVGSKKFRADGETDRHDGAICHFSQCYESA